MRRFAVTNMALMLMLAPAILLATGNSPVKADANAAVCAHTYGKSDGLACNYANYEQCRAAVSGIAGGCVDNPYFRNSVNQGQPRKRTRQ